MRLGSRPALRTLALGVLLCAVAFAAYLGSPAAWRHTCALARSQLPHVLGMDVEIGSCAIEPLSGSLSLRGLVLVPRGAEAPLLSVDVARIRLGASGPFGVSLAQVELERPKFTWDLRPRPGPAAPSASAGKPTCALALFDQVSIHALSIRGGEVEVRLPRGERLLLEGVDVGWKSRRGVLDTQVQVLRGTFEGWGRRPIPVSNVSVEGRLDPDDEALELTRGEAAVDDATVHLTGRVESLCQPRLALDAQVFVPVQALARYLPLPRPSGGHLWAHVSLTGSPAAPNAVVQLQGSRMVLGPYVPGDFSAQLSLSGALVTLTELRSTAGGGTVLMRGKLALGPKLPVELSFETEHASLGAILARTGLPGAWVDFSATGKGELKGHLLPKPELEGDLYLATDNFALTSHPYDAAHGPRAVILEYTGGRVDSRLRLLSDRVEFRGARVSSKNSSARVDTTLYFDVERGLDIQGELEQATFSDFRHIAGLPWEGKGSGTFRIQGPYRNVKLEAHASLHDFVLWGFGLGTVQGQVSFSKDTLSFLGVSGQKGKTAYSGEGALRWPEQGKLHTRGNVQAPDGRVEDVVEILAGLHQNLARLRGALTGKVAATVHIDSPADAFAGDVKLGLEDVAWRGRRLGRGSSVLRFVDGERMVVGRTVLVGAAGTTYVQGRYDWDGALDFRFGGEELSVQEWLGGELAPRLGLDGRCTVSGTWRGDVTNPVASAYLISPRLSLAGRDLGRAHLEARLQGDRLELWGKPLGASYAHLTLSYAAPFPYEGTLQVTLPELRTFLPKVAAAQGVSGALKGSVSLAGQLLDARTFRARARIDELSLTRGDFRGANASPVELTFGNGRLEVQSFSFRAPNTELQAAGTVASDALDVSTHGALDLRLVESFFPMLERSAGRVELNASLRGSPVRPKLVGQAELHDARFSIQDGAWNLRNMDGRVEFSEARVLVSDVHGTLNEGRIALRGDARLQRGRIERMELGLQLDEVTARLRDDLPAVVSGELLLQGRPEQLALGGELELHKLRYDQPLVVEALLADLARRNAASYGTGEKSQEWLTLDVKLRASGDVRVDNNLAKAKLQGAVRLTGTNLRPGFLGTVEAAPGSQLYFRGNQFEISQAMVELKDKQSLDAVFDVHAQTQVREYLVQLHAYGRATQPQVVFTSEPALPEGDILSLLTLGVTSRDKTNTAGTGAGLAAEALFSASGLDREVQRFLPKGPVLRDLHFHIATTYNDGTGLVEPTAQLESKLLTERLKLGMAQPVSGRGTRAQAEYRFHDRLSAQAQWDNQTTDSAFGNLGLDLKLRWEVE